RVSPLDDLNAPSFLGPIPSYQTIPERGLAVELIVKNRGAAFGAIAVSVVGSDLPDGATVSVSSPFPDPDDPSANQVLATLGWSPTAAQAGSYDLVFVAYNGIAPSAPAHVKIAVGPIAYAGLPAGSVDVPVAFDLDGIFHGCGNGPLRCQ